MALLALGAVLVLSRSLFDPAKLPVAVAAAGAAALLALFALTVGETDDAFANAYSAAVSLQNLLPEVPLRLLVVATTGVGTVGALVIKLTSYQSFLLLLGSFFVPLFAVLLADWLRAGKRYQPDDIFLAPRWRVGPIVAWLVGFAVYWWLNPTGGPGTWTDVMNEFHPPGWGVGATVPSFLVAFALGGAVALIAPRATARPQRA